MSIVVDHRAVPLLLSDFHPPAVPVPLHGDLWPGNLASDDGQAVIFDPAGYYGHAEDDLGMTHMFGGTQRGSSCMLTAGFTREFYEAYHATNPPSQPHHDQRIRLYELYHHLNVRPRLIFLISARTHVWRQLCREQSAYHGRTRRLGRYYLESYACM